MTASSRTRLRIKGEADERAPAPGALRVLEPNQARRRRGVRGPQTEDGPQQTLTATATAHRGGGGRAGGAAGADSRSSGDLVYGAGGGVYAAAGRPDSRCHKLARAWPRGAGRPRDLVGRDRGRCVHDQPGGDVWPVDVW